MGGMSWGLECIWETRQGPLPSSSLHSSARESGLTSECNELVTSRVVEVLGGKNSAAGQREQRRGVESGQLCWMEATVGIPLLL